jgi:hypothetical protein
MNSQRTGLGIVRRMVKAYGGAGQMAKNDRRYPTEEYREAPAG